MPLDPALIARLKPLELRARRVVDGYASGLHQNPARGFSVEFAQHREYAPGDDLRYLDWRHHAKSDRYYLKEFESETDFAATLLVDTSESMGYQSAAAPWSKLDCVRTLASATALVLARQRDSVGLMFFDERPQLIRSASSRPSHIKELMNALDAVSPHGETALGSALHTIGDRITRRGVVILFSDLFDELDSLRKGLRRIAHRKHDLRVVQVVDPAEIEFPFEESLRFKGVESESLVAVESRSVAEAYRREFAEHCRGVKSICRELGAVYTLARTDTPPDRLLADMLSRHPR